MHNSSTVSDRSPWIARVKPRACHVDRSSADSSSAGKQSWKRVPSARSLAARTTSSAEFDRTSRLHAEQTIRPTRAKRRRRPSSISVSAATVVCEDDRARRTSLRIAMAGGTCAMRSAFGRSIRSRYCRAVAEKLSMYRRCPSAKSVSNARLLFPEPLTPDNTTSCPSGMSRSTAWRLWTRTPRSSMQRVEGVGDEGRFKNAGMTTVLKSASSVHCAQVQQRQGHRPFHHSGYGFGDLKVDQSLRDWKFETRSDSPTLLPTLRPTCGFANFGGLD